MAMYGTEASNSNVRHGAWCHSFSDMAWHGKERHHHITSRQERTARHVSRKWSQTWVAFIGTSYSTTGRANSAVFSSCRKTEVTSQTSLLQTACYFSMRMQWRKTHNRWWNDEHLNTVVESDCHYNNLDSQSVTRHGLVDKYQAGTHLNTPKRRP